MPTYMVVHTTADHSDYYVLYDMLDAAREAYDELLRTVGISIASIVAVVESTDYDTHPSLLDRSRKAQ